jgi:6-phosphofructokinase
MRTRAQPSSVLTLECGLQTGPNVVLVQEEYAHKTLRNVISDLCDIIDTRAKANMNYGCIIVPESFMAELPIFKHLIMEINDFMNTKTEAEQAAYKEKLLDANDLTPWNFALYDSMPLLFKQQLITMRRSDGTVDMSRVSSEIMLAQLCTEELAKRKKAGTYSGSFAPVTHHFSFQGRSAHPSTFD